MRYQAIRLLAGGAVLAAALLAAVSFRDLTPLPELLPPAPTGEERLTVLGRNGEPLARTYGNRLNRQDLVSLDDVPGMLQRSIVFSEDRRFFEHAGVDWRARAAALVQNVRAMRSVRGASTISEQVVRMLNPRPRTLWSRWIEGIDAYRLERRFNKRDILSFYLNQVPYSANRRGVRQAAREYFGRSLDNLSLKEMLALAVLPRSPSRWDPRNDRLALERAIARLSSRMVSDGLLSAADAAEIDRDDLVVRSARKTVEASHFVRHLRTVHRTGGDPVVRSTVDPSLQQSLQRLLDNRLRMLLDRNVRDGALIVIDHRTDEVLAWVNGDGRPEVSREDEIDAVLTPRQPGSTLKPFLYALALERGYTSSSLVDDSPLLIPVGFGAHRFTNFSGRFYGPLRIREVLGNSLNLPAVRMAAELGVGAFLDHLRTLGMASLGADAEHYGQGLALGTGEVSLFELTRAYAVLARSGDLRDLRLTVDDPRSSGRRIYSHESAAVITKILADPAARAREFGASGILTFPVETAVKTGTSSDYRDAWAMGYSDRYVVGVWFGNLDRSPMAELTGAAGPALILRSAFNELRRRDGASAPIRMDAKLVKRRICRITGLLAGERCEGVDEWFATGKEPHEPCPGDDALRGNVPIVGDRTRTGVDQPRIARPTQGLLVARDPRIPDDLEALPFELQENAAVRVTWVVDGRPVGESDARSGKFLWQIRPGDHTVQAVRADGATSEPVTFTVR